VLTASHEVKDTRVINTLGCIRVMIGPRKALGPPHKPLSDGAFCVQRLVGSRSARDVVEPAQLRTGAAFLAPIELADGVHVLRGEA